MNSDKMKSIIEILKNTRKARFPSDHAINTAEMIPQNFEEDDVYTGQFRKLYEGHSIHGECHYLTYTRFTVTRGNDVVRHITDLNVKNIADPIASLTQHINLGSDEIEDLFLAYLEWSLIEQDVTKDDNEAKQA